MSYPFYRKERPEVFEARFTPATAKDPCVLKSTKIFEAKNVGGEKRFIVTVDGKQRKLIATVDGCTLLVNNQPGDAPAVKWKYTEADMLAALTGKTADEKEKSLPYQVAKKLCSDHATSSKSSHFISGCVKDNFSQSITYDGFKLHLELGARQPFQNPFASGLEAEYFLIGQVLDSECEKIE
jgi:hypothetical protein